VWGVSFTPRPLFTPGKDPIHIVQEAGWAPGPVWTGADYLAITGIRSPDRASRRQSLYRLRFPIGKIAVCNIEWTLCASHFCSFAASSVLSLLPSNNSVWCTKGSKFQQNTIKIYITSKWQQNQKFTIKPPQRNLICIFVCLLSPEFYIYIKATAKPKVYNKAPPPKKSEFLSFLSQSWILYLNQLQCVSNCVLERDATGMRLSLIWSLYW
jgi:hypothetical protein